MIENVIVENGLIFTSRVTHVMKITERMEVLAKNFVSEHFTIENYISIYYGSFSPVWHEAYWLSPCFIMRSNKLYRRPNRQRTTIIPNEMDRGHGVYGKSCRSCRETGHDSTDVQLIIKLKCVLLKFLVV